MPYFIPLFLSPLSAGVKMDMLWPVQLIFVQRHWPGGSVAVSLSSKIKAVYES
jgi:hypothetical protein